MLTTLLRSLRAPIAQVVHLGAGPGDDLPAYLASGAGAILVVDADPGAVAELIVRSQDDPRVRVVHSAVSADAQPRPFFRANVPYLSSLRPVDGLRALFPGLRVESDEIATPTDPVSMLDGRLDQDGSNLLVMETPAETLGILRALEGAGLLHRFDAVLLREWREAFHPAGAAAYECRDLLERSGFLIEMEPEAEDPDLPWIAGRLNRALFERVDKAETRIADLEQSLAAEREAVAERVGSLEATLDDERKAATSRIASLEASGAESDKAAASNAAELDRAREHAEALIRERSAAYDHAKSQTEARETAESRLERQADELLAAKRRADVAHAEVARIRAEGVKANAVLQSRLDTALRDLSVALRGQAMAQADLRDLQARYAETRAAQEALSNLLTDLEPYLRKLLGTTLIDENLRQAIELKALPDQAPPAIEESQDRSETDGRTTSRS